MKRPHKMRPQLHLGKLVGCMHGRFFHELFGFVLWEVLQFIQRKPLPIK
jgi:hypothetical protein